MPNTITDPDAMLDHLKADLDNARERCADAARTRDQAQSAFEQAHKEWSATDSAIKALERLKEAAQ